MIEVNVMITVGENAAPGNIIGVMNSETIPAAHDDPEGLFLQVKAAIDRLADDVKERAIDQADHWAKQQQTPSG